jgi:hypothetical protein
MFRLVRRIASLESRCTSVVLNPAGFGCARLHWSLVIVCHPGLACGVLSPAVKAQRAAADGEPGLQPRPCFIHLDSLSCHGTSKIVRTLRA